MDIIKPPHRKAARPVEKIADVRRDILTMRKMLDDGKLDLKNSKPLFLKHGHISYQPKKVFVLRKILAKYAHHHLVFINPQVIELPHSKDFVKYAYTSPVYPEKGEQIIKVPPEIVVQFTSMSGSRIKARMHGAIAALVYCAISQLDHRKLARK